MSPRKRGEREKEDIGVEWRCYYCKQVLGVSSLGEGAKLGKCPKCGRMQTGKGITIIDGEITNYLKDAERKLKDEERLRSSRD